MFDGLPNDFTIFKSQKKALFSASAGGKICRPDFHDLQILVHSRAGGNPPP
jgi:hypothetical protein